MKSPKFLIRYIVEGTLIFGSVYGAFLLEDYRSKSEQENLFVKRWNGLVSSISSDSIKFNALLLDKKTGELFHQELGVYKWINRDSSILEKYDQLIANGRVFPIIESLDSYGYWAMSWTVEAPFYTQIIENHPDHYLDLCIKDPELCDLIDLYFQLHRRINRYNRHTREQYISYWSKMKDSYPSPEIASSSDSLAIAEDLRSHNFLLSRYRHTKKFTLPAIESLIELNNKMMPELRDLEL